MSLRYLASFKGSNEPRVTSRMGRKGLHSSSSTFSHARQSIIESAFYLLSLLSSSSTTLHSQVSVRGEDGDGSVVLGHFEIEKTKRVPFFREGKKAPS